MPDAIARPLFTEGEILSAQELNDAQDGSRARDARHARQAHRWGIVAGLALTGKSGAAGYDVTVPAGVARDVRGREIVVPTDTLLSPDDFQGVSGPKDAWFPVFLIGISQTVAGAATTGACGGSGGQRVEERFQIQFGRPDQADGWEDAEQAKVPAVDEGPDSPSAQDIPQVLLGFVQWDPGPPGRFTKAALANSTGVTPRYAGVRGGAWESVDSSVRLDVGADDQQALAVRVKSAGDQPILTLSRQGNLTIQGTINTALPLQVRLASGVATDGVKLPLPAGVAESDVGVTVTLHVVVAPRATDPLVALECGVDDQRRVRCRAATLTLAGAGNAVNQLAAAAYWPVDFLVLAGPKG
jgi:hypothetical protein